MTTLGPGIADTRSYLRASNLSVVNNRGGLPSDRLSVMSGPSLEDRLVHLTEGLADAERRQAAGEPYTDPESSWPDRISKIKQHLAEVREMIANE